MVALSNAELLVRAERQLDRTQAFFSRIDAKQSALLATALAMIAVYAVNLNVADLASVYVILLGLVFGALLLLTFYYLLKCAVPHLKGGGGRSLYFFSTISGKSESMFVQEYRAATEERMIDDALEQVWRNSEIVAQKFRHLKSATICIVLSAAPWTATLVLASVAHHRLPLIMH